MPIRGVVLGLGDCKRLMDCSATRELPMLRGTSEETCLTGELMALEKKKIYG